MPWTLEVRRPPRVELEHHVRDGLEEPAVVCDDHDSRVERLQLALEPFEAFDVQVVRRLVEEQEIRVAAERTRERGARQLTAGESLELAIELLLRETEPAHDGGRALAPVVAAGMLEPRLCFAVPAN